MLTDFPLACPLDGLPLTVESNQLRCDHGHTFDVARQGYVNLLPVQNKRSLQPGDSREMVLARQSFLNHGWYQPLADSILQLMRPHLQPQMGLLDAGCGEGYYLDYVARNTGVPLRCVGNDISKVAILHACQRSRQHTWLVASNRALPLMPQSVDMLMCLFGFPVYAEFQRVLKPEGLMLLVDAGADHLRELREQLYPELKEKQDLLVTRAQAGGFSLLQEQRVQFVLQQVGAEQLHSLLLMTPHFFRAKPEVREQVLAATQQAVTVDVWLRLFRQ